MILTQRICFSSHNLNSTWAKFNSTVTTVNFLKIYKYTKQVQKRNRGKISSTGITGRNHFYIKMATLLLNGFCKTIIQSLAQKYWELINTKNISS